MSSEPADPDFRPHRVVVLALDGLLPFELGIPHRIFGRPKDNVAPFNSTNQPAAQGQ